MSEERASEITAAERAVVGTCLFAPATVRELIPIVSPDDFADTRLGAIYSLIIGMVSAYGPDGVTAVSVTAEARRRASNPAVNASRTSPKVVLPDLNELLELMTHGLAGMPQVHAKLIREEAIRRALAVHGSRIVTSAYAGMDAAVLASMAVEQARAIRDGYQTGGLPFRSLAAVLGDTSLDDYDWVIPGLLERSDRLIITGGEGLGKSTFIRQLAICAAAGLHPFNPRERFPEQTVLVIDVENSERQWHRKTGDLVGDVTKISGKNPAASVHLACIGRRDITAAKDLGDIHSALDEYQPDLLVIGPLYKLVPNAINNDSDAAPLINALDSIRERGVTLVMEAHAGKGLGQGGERNFAPRGSAALLGWPEFGFGLAPDPHDPKRAHVIRWRGDRDERGWPKVIERGGVMPWTATTPVKAPATGGARFGLQASD